MAFQSSSNPLNTKLEIIYNTSLDSADCQKALNLLDKYIKNENRNSSKSARNITTESAGTTEAPIKTTHQTQTHQLQKVCDSQLLSLHQEFVESFENVYNEMKDMENEMFNLAKSCEDIKSSLEVAFSNNKNISNLLDDLKRKRQESDLKTGLSSAFLSRFTLPSEKIKYLSSSSEATITSEFFDNLSLLQNIHKDCSVLLSLSHQTAGLELLDTLNGIQEAAYERLFKWTQRECWKMKHETPEIGSEFRKAMHAFRIRPILFDACIEEISTIRHEALSKAFYAALTIGGPTGIPKPIDFHAHDPQRYAGDILAWIHQACVGEREMLDAVFGLASRADRRRKSVVVPNAFEGVEGYQASIEAVLNVLDKNTQGLCFIFTKRLDSLYASDLGCLVSFKIANMFQFYNATIIELLGSVSKLSIAMKRVSESAMVCFHESLKTQSKDLRRTIPPIPANLEVPVLVRDSLGQLKEILVSLDMSLISSPSPATATDVNGKEAETELILKAFVDPLIFIVQQGAEELSPIEGAIYLVNSYHQIQTCLSGFAGYTEHQVQVLSDLISQQIDVLFQEQYHSMLFMSGFSGIVAAIATKPEGEPMSLYTPTNKQNISTAFKRLDEFLQHDLNMDVAENLYMIQSVDISKRVASRGRLLFLSMYKDFVARIMDPVNKYEFPASLVPRSPGELSVLIGSDSLI